MNIMLGMNKKSRFYIFWLAAVIVASFFLPWIKIQPMLGKGLVHIKADIGIYFIILAYLGMGLIGMKSLLR